MNKLGLVHLADSCRLAGVQVKIAEGCAGAATGTYALKALAEELGFEPVTTSVSEPVSWKQNFMFDNHPGTIRHIYSDIKDQVCGGYCNLHGLACPATEEEDFFLFGPPCQPYTRLSTKRMREDYHPFANDERTKPFLDGSRLIRKRRPKIVVMEEVADILARFPKQCKGPFFDECKELGELTKKVVSNLMCADIVINKEKYSPAIDAYRKVCKYMASKLGSSPSELPPLLKQKLDNLTDSKTVRSKAEKTKEAPAGKTEKAPPSKKQKKTK